MEITLNGINLLLLVCIVQGIVLGSWLVIRKEGNNRANRFLGLLIVAVSLDLIHLFFSLSGLFGKNPDLYMLPIYYSFAFGPLLYFYIRAMTKEDFRFDWRRQGWHFLPVIIQAAFYVYTGLSSYETKGYIWENIHAPYTYPFEGHFREVSFAAYLLASIFLVRNYQMRIRQFYSSLEAITLRWLYRVLLAIGSVWLIALLEPLIHDLFGVHPFHLAHILPPLLVYFLGLSVLIRKGHFPPKEKAEPLGSPLLKEETLQQLSTRLTNYMEREKLYLNPELKLSDLANTLDVPVKTISYVINTGQGKNFYDFVNSYRIREVSERLVDPRFSHLSLLGIAFDCGFNSKATFNRTFKKITGSSPKDVREKMRSQNMY